jgi:glycosyltransferase involved in cell wall biosynthesis
MQTVVAKVSQLLIKRNVSVEVVTSTIGGGRKGVCIEQGVPVRRNLGWTVCNTPIILGYIRTLMQIQKPAIFHVHTAHVGIAEATILIAQLRKIPCIVHVHSNLNPVKPLGRFIKPYQKAIWGPLLRKTSRIVVPTKDYEEILRNEYNVPKKQITTIPNGIELHTYKNLRKKNTRIGKIARILFVGRLSNQKNVPLLLRALAQLKSSIPISVRIVGEGEERKRIEQLIRQLGLSGRVRLVGAKHGVALQKEYMNADIFVLSSRFETFGVVILEAMASGVPVVATDIPGVRSIISHRQNGLLCAQEVTSLANTIQLAINNSALRHRITQRALENVKEYEWGKIIPRYLDIYKQVFTEQGKYKDRHGK